MFTYLWLACHFLRSALRSRCDVALENLALRQQLVVLVPTTAPHEGGSPVLVVALACLASLAIGARHRPAGHRGPLAPRRLGTPLGLEEQRVLEPWGERVSRERSKI